MCGYSTRFFKKLKKCENQCLFGSFFNFFQIWLNDSAFICYYFFLHLCSRWDKTISRLAHRRLSQKPNDPIWFFSGNTWNLKFQVFLDCHWKKQNLFVRFYGESMAYQSAFGFIWPLSLRPLAHPHLDEK